MKQRWSVQAGAALLLWLLLATSPVRQLLEASMTAQMLLQLPMLVLLGAWLAFLLPDRAVALLAPWDRGGISGLVLASVTSLVWMLPLALDAAIDEPWVAVGKFLSLPLLVGLPFALSWSRMGFVLRGVFFAEAIATCFRLGWLYLASPQRLCSNYLLDDQQRLGHWLLVLGIVLILALATKLLAGRFDGDPGHKA